MKIVLSDQEKKAFSLIEISIVILIIGILIGGVASGSRLINKAKLSAAQNLTSKAPFEELDSKVMGGWETIAGSITSVQNGTSPKTGDSVSSWKGANSLALKLVQNSSGNQPKYSKSGMNGLPSIEFDGAAGDAVGDFLFSETKDPSLVSNNFSVFIVTKHLGNSANSTILLNGDSSSPSSGYAIDYSNFGTPAWGSSHVPTNGSGTGLGYTSYPVITDKPYILFYRFSGDPAATIRREFFINNLQVFNGTVANGYLPPNQVDSSYSFRIGCGTVMVFGCYKGSISELVVFGEAISDEDKDTVHQYLSKKWGIK